MEAGVRSQVLRDMRVCQFCKTDIGDKFHYLLCCVHFKEERRKYIEAKYYIRPSTMYLQELFKQAKGEKLKHLAIFAKIKICLLLKKTIRINYLLLVTCNFYENTDTLIFLGALHKCS